MHVLEPDFWPGIAVERNIERRRESSALNGARGTTRFTSREGDAPLSPLLMRGEGGRQDLFGRDRPIKLLARKRDKHWWHRDPMNPSERIDQLIAGLTDWRGKTLASIRKSIVKADREIIEE
jgi:hypothetical protein